MISYEEYLDTVNDIENEINATGGIENLGGSVEIVSSKKKYKPNNRKGRCGRKNRGLTEQYKHFSIMCTKEDWDRLNFLADGANKTVSRFVADTCLASDGINHEYIPPENRIRKSLCFLRNEWEQIKDKADYCNLSLSNYIFSVI